MLVAVAFSLADNHHFVKQKQIPVPESEEETGTQQPSLHIPSPLGPWGKGSPPPGTGRTMPAKGGSLCLDVPPGGWVKGVCHLWPECPISGPKKLQVAACQSQPREVPPLRFCISNRPSQIPPPPHTSPPLFLGPFKSHLLWPAMGLSAGPGAPGGLGTWLVAQGKPSPAE